MVNKSEYNSRLEWAKANPNDYQCADKKGYLKEICEIFGWSMPKKVLIRIPLSYWTKERCLEEARKYKNRSGWKRNSSSSYKAARTNGWYNECIKHMIIVNSWTLEQCLEIALKCKSKKEWTVISTGSIQAARKYGWLEECCAHMILTRKPVGYWNIKENCIKDALKYTGIKQWAKASGSASSGAVRNGWFDECTVHMERKINVSGHWTFERCKEEALKYTIKERFKHGSTSAYGKARIMGWIDDICSHMVLTRKPVGYWHIKENCLEEARKYKTRSEWVKFGDASVRAAKQFGWYDECTSHMVLIKNTSGYWNNKERCIEEARKHKTYGEWSRASQTSLKYARRNNWVDECTAHMPKKGKTPGYWQIKENVLEDARKYKTRSNWAKATPGAYKQAKDNGWHEEATAHMKIIRKVKK